MRIIYISEHQPLIKGRGDGGRSITMSKGDDEEWVPFGGSDFGDGLSDHSGIGNDHQFRHLQSDQGQVLVDFDRQSRLLQEALCRWVQDKVSQPIGADLRGRK